jgi:hypothetical protein
MSRRLVGIHRGEFVGFTCCVKCGRKPRDSARGALVVYEEPDGRIVTELVHLVCAPNGAGANDRPRWDATVRRRLVGERVSRGWSVSRIAKDLKVSRATVNRDRTMNLEHALGERAPVANSISEKGKLARG